MEGAALDWLASLRNPLFSTLGLGVLAAGYFVVRLSNQLHRCQEQRIEEMRMTMKTLEAFTTSNVKLTEAIADLKETITQGRRR